MIINKKSKRRGYGRKNIRKNEIKKNVQFSLLGTNAAGLSSKKESLFQLINKFSPSVFTIQESKLRKPGLLKIPGYQVFEKTKTSKSGGGLLTAAVEDLNPVLVSTGSNETEVLTIQVKCGANSIRTIKTNLTSGLRWRQK